MGDIPKDIRMVIWNEDIDITHSSGIPRNDIEEYGDNSIEGLRIVDETKNMLRKIFKNVKVMREKNLCSKLWGSDGGGKHLQLPCDSFSS